MRANTIGEPHDIFNTPPLARDLLFSTKTPQPIDAGAAAAVPDSKMGHMMMLEPGWPRVAERIAKWLGDRGL